MTPWMRVDIAVVAIMAIVLTCTQGLKIDQSQLKIHRPSFHAQKRNEVCNGNPCEASTPFLCRSGAKCIDLKFVCDGTWNCDDGFDEDPIICIVPNRPRYEDILDFLESDPWMAPNFFNGTDPKLVARALTVARDMNELSEKVGLTDEKIRLLREAFEAASEEDEEPLLAMGMPDRSWQEVQYYLQDTLGNDFKF